MQKKKKMDFGTSLPIVSLDMAYCHVLVLEDSFSPFLFLLWSSPFTRLSSEYDRSSLRNCISLIPLYPLMEVTLHGSLAPLFLNVVNILFCHQEYRREMHPTMCQLTQACIKSRGGGCASFLGRARLCKNHTKNVFSREKSTLTFQNYEFEFLGQSCN